MKNISFKAIISGFMAGVVMSVIINSLIGGVIGAFVGIAAGKAGQNPTISAANYVQSLYTTSPLYIMSRLAVGLLSDVLGGYVVASSAPQRKLFNAGLCGALSTLIGLFGFSDFPLWSSLLSSLLIIPATLLGGWLRIKTARSSTALHSSQAADQASAPISGP